MTATRIQVIGAGPGGLMAARLLKLRHPGWAVEVHERMAPVATFGFGVGLTGRTLRNLHAADPEVHDALVQVSHPGGRARLHGFKDSTEWGGSAGTGGVAIGRAALLEVLQAHAQEAGVVVQVGSELGLADADADLLIAADGAASATREKLAGALGATVETGRGLYIWCGLDSALDLSLFAPVQTDYGTFVTHAYAYATGRSTVLIETDEATWRKAGFDAPRDYASDGASDEDSIAFLQDAFAPFLGGGQLIGNRSRWLRFRTVRCDTWHDGTTVLLGDAARTAHYSLGSGTKLAIEDAIALTDSLTDGTPLAAGLSAYEASRRPAAVRIQDLAHRSHLWWDAFPRRADRPSVSITFAYLSRGGAVPLSVAAAHEPTVAGGALARFAGCAPQDVPGDVDALATWVLSRRCRVGSLDLTSRVFGGEILDVAPAVTADGPLRCTRVTVNVTDWMGDEADLVLQRCREAVAAGDTAVVLTGAPTRPALLDRLALGERLRLETPAVAVVEGHPDHLADLVDGLVAGRADLVSVSMKESSA